MRLSPLAALRRDREQFDFTGLFCRRLALRYAFQIGSFLKTGTEDTNFVVSQEENSS
jgi:hypothetical protein